MTTPVNIIAVGGGKGGIGKSVICTNLAAGMALSGQKIILMDTDFGASNLHALLGIGNPAYGFQDFFTDKVTDPKALLLDTGISNLKFVSGAGDNPGSANIDSEKIGAIVSFIKICKQILFFSTWVLEPITTSLTFLISAHKVWF